MIDKILIVSDNEVAVIYDDRSPLTITSDDGSALTLLMYMLRNKEHILNEETQPCIILGAA